MKTKNPANITFKQLEDLFRGIGKSITSSLDISAISNIMMDKIDIFFQPSNASIFMIDPSGQELYFLKAKGLDAKIMANIRLKVGEGIVGIVAETGKSIFIDDAQHDARFSKKVDKLTGFKTQSIIAVPMIFQKKVLGVIELINAVEAGSYTKQQQSILETIADFSAIAMNNAQTFERLAWLAAHDQLTKIYNFAHFDSIVNKIIADASKPYNHKRKSQTSNMMVIWADIDKFKQVNDCYGHQVGNDILAKAASLLQDCCRKNDYVFRVGGDEFVMLMLDIQMDDIDAIKDRISKQLMKASRSLAPAKGFSFGIAVGPKTELKALIKQADLKMYECKSRGGVSEKSG